MRDVFERFQASIIIIILYTVLEVCDIAAATRNFVDIYIFYARVQAYVY